MSERTDMKNKIPEYTLDNKSMVYHSKKWLNHLAQTVRYLLNKSITSKNSTVDVNSDWDKLESNTVSQVNNWGGPHSPQLEGTGVVITLSNSDGYQDYQCALSEGEFASRLRGQKWSYTDGSDHNELIKVGHQIQNLIRENNTLSNSLVSDTDATFSRMHKNTSSLSNATSSLSTSTSSGFSSATNRLNINSNQINTLNNVKEDKTSEASDVAVINKILATKENTLDGVIPNPDLNDDTKVGNFVINKPTELRHDPHTTFQHHDSGFLQVRHCGDNDLIQILYLALGNPNNQTGDNPLDGSGAVSYRFMYSQNQVWQPWHTIPYQSDFSNFRNQTNSNFAKENSEVSSYVTSLNDHILDNSNKATGYTNSMGNTLRSYADSENSVANSIANTYYNNTNSKETSDFDQITNQMNSMTSSARSETVVQAHIEASNLVNSFNSASGSMTGKLQDALLNIGTFEENTSATNENTQGQINSLKNSISNNYNDLDSANVQLNNDVPDLISNSINNNNTALNAQWTTELSNNNNSLNNHITTGDNNTLSAANSYTKSVGNDNYNFANNQAGSIDTRLWGLSSEFNSPAVKEPASKVDSLANELSDADIDGMSNQIEDVDNSVDEINDNLSNYPTWDDENWTRNTLVPSYANSINGNINNKVNLLNNSINSHPTWNDENWTRNNIIPSYANSAVSTANSYSTQKATSLNSGIQSNANSIQSNVYNIQSNSEDIQDLAEKSVIVVSPQDFQYDLNKAYTDEYTAKICYFPIDGSRNIDNYDDSNTIIKNLPISAGSSKLTSINSCKIEITSNFDLNIDYDVLHETVIYSGNHSYIICTRTQTPWSSENQDIYATWYDWQINPIDCNIFQFEDNQTDASNASTNDPNGIYLYPAN